MVFLDSLDARGEGSGRDKPEFIRKFNSLDRHSRLIFPSERRVRRDKPETFSFLGADIS